MIFTHWLTALVFSVVLMMVGGPSEAEDLNFLGTSVFSQKGTFLVTKRANVRIEPMTNSKKLGVLKAGEEVQVVGRAKKGAGWMAIQKNGKDYGFVYEPVLLPKIDGALEDSISGSVAIEQRGRCGYIFNYDEKNIVEGENYIFSDYEITYRCNIKGEPFRMLAAMFISEVPFRLTREPVFQISIDLMEVENDYDEIFSTIFDYRLKDKKVVFVGISLKDMAREPIEKERHVNSVAQALKAAVEIAPGAWGEEAWKQIHKAQFKGD
jgi:hypothetical protein